MIGPIERMMTLVKKLADNPLESASMDQQYLEDDKVGANPSALQTRDLTRPSTQDMKNDGYETALLETTLERVVSTLKGFAHVEIVLDKCFNVRSFGGTMGCAGLEVLSLSGCGNIEGACA